MDLLKQHTEIDDLSQNVWWYLSLQGQYGNHPQCSDKSQNSYFLEKIIFFYFGGIWKLFWPQKPYWAIKTSYFWNFLIWAMVLELQMDGKIAIFRHNQPWKSPKPWLGSKSGKRFLQWSLWTSCHRIFWNNSPSLT